MPRSNTRWGWNQAEGVWFFFELGREKPTFCPLSDPKCNLFCPHKTVGVEVLKRSEPSIYWTTKKVEFNPKYNVKHSVVKYSGIRTLPILREMGVETNYVPVIITNANVSQDWRSFCLRLQRFVEQYGRSVVLELLDEYVPVLPNWIKLTNLKELGLKEYKNGKTIRSNV